MNLDWLKTIGAEIGHLFSALPIEPIQFVYGVVALCGGVARYLNGVASNGMNFNFGIFCASAFVSGFSGYMFALLGLTLSLPQNLVFIMAGTGGFFGDQTMKLIMEYIQAKATTS